MELILAGGSISQSDDVIVEVHGAIFVEVINFFDAFTSLVVTATLHHSPQVGSVDEVVGGGVAGFSRGTAKVEAIRLA